MSLGRVVGTPKLMAPLSNEAIDGGTQAARPLALSQTAP
jgi:hypothetical protein